MKKSLIALAVLAASSAAMAQSSVTLFGRLDAGFSVTDTERTGASPRASQSQNEVNSSTFNTTYWGMRGTEDLGGGLKANFNLQSGFAIDTGAGNTRLFERNATVGLSGGFGAVNLGRQYTPFYAIYGATTTIGNANVDAEKVYGAGIRQGGGTTTRASNAIRYDSPSFSGVTVSALYGFGENEKVAPNVGDATDVVSLAVMYKAGPLLVGYGHHQETLSQASLATAQDENTYDMIGATYDFGMAKVNFGYQNVDNNATTDDEYNVGVSIPFGSAATLWLGYADSTSETNGFELNSDGYTLAGTYNLSKRTKLYGAYVKTSIETGTRGAVTTEDTDKFAVGVVHLF